MKEKQVYYDQLILNKKKKEKIITDEGKGELDIGFNVTYLTEALNNINAEQIGFSFNDSQSSAVITNLEDKEFKYIVMPMRLKWNLIIHLQLKYLKG